jgi:AcrR family transcriptional regulator
MNASSGMSSHDRILFSGKALFARNGYENTSTVAIARQAGTSESQLMKHFGSKQGLLAAIFELGWANILQRAKAVSSNGTASPHVVLDVLQSLISELDRDPEMKTLLMLESRRVRKDNPDLVLSTGAVQFGSLLENVLADMRKKGALHPDLDIRATRAALYGMVEGMIFDQLTSSHRGNNGSYDGDHVLHLLQMFVDGLVCRPVQATA